MEEMCQRAAVCIEQANCGKQIAPRGKQRVWPMGKQEGVSVCQMMKLWAEDDEKFKLKERGRNWGAKWELNVHAFG